MFARFDENPAMTLRVIKETKRYGRTDGCTDGQSENSIPPTNKVCGGYKKKKKYVAYYKLIQIFEQYTILKIKLILIKKNYCFLKCRNTINKHILKPMFHVINMETLNP